MAHQQVESRLLVGDLIARCMDIGISKKELMEVVTGTPGDVAILLEDLWQNEAIETRVRHFREVVTIANSICGAETGAWLRTENPALGQRSPLQTLLDYPHALAGMMHMLRRYVSDDERLH